jgi:hypothetical protein
MTRELQHTFDKLESQRTQLIAEIEGLSLEALTTSPEGKWSIIHILSHVIAGERGALEYVSKKILGATEAGNSGFLEEMKLALFKISQRATFLRYNAPRGIVDRTVVYKDLAEVKSEWAKVRSEWKSFLESLPDEHASKKIFRHVIGGRFNIRQGLVILQEHLGHHVPQIRARRKDN